MDQEKATIYDSQFVKQLFNEMSQTYEVMNYITSFGFSDRWRKQCVSKASIIPGTTVYDLMTGMGECWSYILKDIGSEGSLVAVDFSEEMILNAENKKKKLGRGNIRIIKEGILNNTIPDASADFIISGFGLKTFSNEQLILFASEIKRILKQGGKFSLVEISKPENFYFKFFYLFYLKRIIPVLGKLLLGNPDNYRMLGVYTDQFQNCRRVKDCLEKVGLQVNYHSFFFSCATGLSGKKELL